MLSVASKYSKSLLHARAVCTHLYKALYMIYGSILVVFYYAGYAYEPFEVGIRSRTNSLYVAIGILECIAGSYSNHDHTRL